MKLLRQILSEAGADTGEAFTVVPGFGAYFQNVRSVVEYSEERVVLAVGRATVVVTGERLTVGNYFQRDLLLLGNVFTTAYNSGA